MDKTDPSRLAELLRISGGIGPLWPPEELGEILRHQLSAPVEFDLGSLPAEVKREVRLTASAKGLLLKSFSDLLQHPRPPIKLLRMTKDFAKAHRESSSSPLPREIATILYFATIAVALVRCRQRISTLSDTALRDGFTWAREQDWTEEAIRTLFAEGLKALQG